MATDFTKTASNGDPYAGSTSAGLAEKAMSFGRFFTAHQTNLLCNLEFVIPSGLQRQDDDVEVTLACQFHSARALVGRHGPDSRTDEFQKKTECVGCLGIVVNDEETLGSHHVRPWAI